MASTPSPAQCLTQIQEDLPGWLERIETLSRTVNTRCAEWREEAERQGREPSLRRERTGSMESLKPLDDVRVSLSPPASPEPESSKAGATSLQPLRSNVAATSRVGHVDVDPNNKHLFREIREQRKKRKNPSLKEGASGPSRFRVKSKVTIWYDSSIQSEFEALVRNISGARNTLRKGKTAASFRTQAGTFKDDESLFGAPHQIRGAPRMSRHGSSFCTGVKTGLEIYDSIDRELEGAQTLCEVGAHQFLRDGDCFDELATTKTKIKKCLDMLADEIASLSRRDSIEQELPVPKDQKRDPRRKQSISDIDPDSIAIDGYIEADENSDQSSIEIDLTKLPSRRHYSSRHIMMGELAMKMDDKEPSTSSSKTSPTSTRPESQSYTVDTVESTRPTKTSSGTAMAIEVTAAEPCTYARASSDRENLVAASTPVQAEKREASGSEPSSLQVEIAGAAAAPEVHGKTKTAELDLAAMRMAVGGRARPAVPESVDTSAAQSVIAKAAAANANPHMTSLSSPNGSNAHDASASDDDSEPDLAAMRAAIKRRTRRHIDASVSSAKRRAAEKITDEAKASGGFSVNNTVPIGNHDPDGNEIPAVPEFAIDTSHMSNEDVQASVIPPELMAILKNGNGLSRT